MTAEDAQSDHRSDSSIFSAVKTPPLNALQLAGGASASTRLAQEPAAAAAAAAQSSSIWASQPVPEALKRSIMDTKVNYRRVGSSGLRVSDPILGTMGIGDTRWLNWVIGQDQAAELLLAAYNAGINTWDTANAYSNGESESIIGYTIQKYHIPRNKLVLMTKVGRIVGDDAVEGEPISFLEEEVSKSKDYVNQYGLSRTAILDAVDQSLRRLQTTYIDVLHIHRWDPHTPIQETMGALNSLVCAGKVRYLAASSMWAFQLAQLQHTATRNGWHGIVAIQCHYNLLYREEEREMLKFCDSAGIGVLAWAPLAEGYLARPLDPHGAMSTRSARSATGSRFGYGASDADREIITRAQHIAEKRGVAMSHVALAWLRRRGVTSAIVGINSVARMDEILSARGFQLSGEEDASLGQPYLPKAVQGHC